MRQLIYVSAKALFSRHTANNTHVRYVDGVVPGNGENEESTQSLGDQFCFFFTQSLRLTRELRFRPIEKVRSAEETLTRDRLVNVLRSFCKFVSLYAVQCEFDRVRKLSAWNSRMQHIRH